MAKAQVKFKITGDTSGLKKATNEAQGLVGSFSGKVKGLLGPMAAAAGTAFATDKIVAFGGEIFGLSSKLSTWEAKSSAVFEGSAASVRKWADQNNEAFGISEQELAGLTASFGDLLKPMGFTAKETAGMSTKIVGLAGALSAWSGGNKSAAEATDIMAKAMLGERDGLTELGIKISELDVQQKLAAKGQDKLTGAALEQAKAVATQELIFEKSTDAQKAWANGSLDAQKNTNKLKATLEDLKAKLAEKATPFIQRGVEWLAGPGLEKAKEFAGGVQRTVGPLIEWFRDNWGQISAVVASVGKVWLTGWRAQIEVAKRLVAGVSALWERWGPSIKQAVGQAAKFIGDLGARVQKATGGISGIIATITPVIQRVGAELSALWARFGGPLLALGKSIIGAVVAVATTVGKVVGGVVIGVVRVATDLWNRFGTHIVQYLITTWNNVQQVFGGVITMLTGVFNLIKSILTGKWGEAWNAVKQILSGAWNVILGVVKQAINAVATAIGAAMAVISAAWGYVWGGIKTVAGWVWDGIKAAIGAAIGWVADQIASRIALIQSGWSAVWNGIKDVASAVWDGIRSIIDSGVGAIKTAIEGIRDFGSGIWDGLSSSAKGAFNAIASAWNSTVGELSFTAPSWVPVIGGKSFSVPKIPTFATGGVVTRPTVGLMGEYPGARSNPEIVSPRSMMAEVVESAIAKAGGSTTDRPIVIKIEMDSRVVAQAMIPHLRMAL